MPTKIAEKKLAVSLACLAAAIFIFSKTTIITTPVRVSEKGLGLLLVAVTLLAIAIRFFKRAIVKP